MPSVGLSNYTELRTVARSHIIGWRKDMERRKLSTSTIRRKLSALFDYLCERNAVAGNPVDGVKRPTANGNEGSTPALGARQARKLLESPPADTLKGVRDRAGPDGIRWTDFFARMDVGDEIAARLVDLPGHLPAMRDCLAMVGLPDAEPGSHCGTSYPCEFKERCTAHKPADWISYLPYLSQARGGALKALGIEAISAIPADFPLT
jgi:hypothetical protein